MMVYNLCEQEGDHKIERGPDWAVHGTGVIANEMAAALDGKKKALCSGKQDL